MTRHVIDPVDPDTDYVERVDVDPGALTRRLTLKDPAGVTAHVHDLLTGDNSVTVTLDHSGPGNGCVLGIPLCWRNHNVDERTFGSDTNAMFYAVIPHIMPAGETTISASFERYPEGGLGVATLQARSLTDFSIVASSRVNDAGNVFLEGLTGGTSYVFTLHGVGQFATQTTAWRSVTLYHQRVLPPHAPMYAPHSQPDTTDPLPVPVSSDLPSLVDFDAEFMADTYAYDAYHCNNLNRNQNALDEALTGAPVGVNSALTLAYTGATNNPTTSPFHDGSRAGWANEPVPQDFPIALMLHGCCETDGDTPTTSTWKGPGLTSSATDSTLGVTLAYVPDFPVAAGGLTMFVVAHSPNGSMAAGTTVVVPKFKISDKALTAIGTTAGTFVRIGTTKFWYAKIVSTDVQEDDMNALEFIANANPKAGSAEDFRVLGVWYGYEH